MSCSLLLLVRLTLPHVPHPQPREAVLLFAYTQTRSAVAARLLVRRIEARSVRLPCQTSIARGAVDVNRLIEQRALVRLGWVAVSGTMQEGDTNS